MLCAFCVLVFFCDLGELAGSLVLAQNQNPCGNVRLVWWRGSLSFHGEFWSSWQSRMLDNEIVGADCLFVAFLLYIVLLLVVSLDRRVPSVDATFPW